MMDFSLKNDGFHSVVATVTLLPGETVTVITVMHTSRDAATIATGDP